eukprot:CAMPEP_0113303294 /NCGR_PEP_ID=MMETSP0010_2-20120614/3769_1 /TAXON_ID=216773 ORGANISM="Corethron hystrix, Strain 308" /NCGR_SAMPLE_ID=MMETSP0010_2 /ASSEMBLY_ACC=CAM_ASM_000155 /LENGTH=38 /DNA_ID=CAMNT_0000157265 /DNA_START=377 /DNA_END=493 /DNA_ORIENTATION=+ /assembly_acc=CAM_ASM_000155
MMKSMLSTGLTFAIFTGTRAVLDGLFDARMGARPDEEE